LGIFSSFDGEFRVDLEGKRTARGVEGLEIELAFIGEIFGFGSLMMYK
jgi:hypothetical protein